MYGLCCADVTEAVTAATSSIMDQRRGTRVFIHASATDTRILRLGRDEEGVSVSQYRDFWPAKGMARPGLCQGPGAGLDLLKWFGDSVSSVPVRRSRTAVSRLNIS